MNMAEILRELVQGAHSVLCGYREEPRVFSQEQRFLGIKAMAGDIYRIGADMVASETKNRPKLEEMQQELVFHGK